MVILMREGIQMQNDEALSRYEICQVRELYQIVLLVLFLFSCNAFRLFRRVSAKLSSHYCLYSFKLFAVLFKELQSGA